MDRRHLTASRQFFFLDLGCFSLDLCLVYQMGDTVLSFSDVFWTELERLGVINVAPCPACCVAALPPINKNGGGGIATAPAPPKPKAIHGGTVVTRNPLGGIASSAHVPSTLSSFLPEVSARFSAFVPALGLQ